MLDFIMSNVPVKCTSIQLLGSMAFCTLELGKWYPRRSRGCHFPSRVYQTHGPQSQRATIVLLYLCIIVFPLLEVLSSSNNITTIRCLISRRTRNNSLEPTVMEMSHTSFGKTTNCRDLKHSMGAFV